MGKLLENLERLALPDAADQLLEKSGEKIKVAHFYQFAFDGKLQLSIEQMNPIPARYCTLVDQTELDETKSIDAISLMEEAAATFSRMMKSKILRVCIHCR